MAKKESKTKRRKRDADSVDVLVPMVKEYYMVRLRLTRDDLAAGAGVSAGTISRMFRRKKAPMRTAGYVLGFLEERIAKKNETIEKRNAERADGEKEDLIPMITSLSTCPPGYRWDDERRALVRETGGVEEGESRVAAGKEVLGGPSGGPGASSDPEVTCVSVGALESCIKGLLRHPPSEWQSSQDDVFVIHVSPGKSMSIVKMGGAWPPGLQRDEGRARHLNWSMKKELERERRGKEPSEKGVDRWFIAAWSPQGWVRIVEVIARAKGVDYSHVGLLDRRNECRVFLDERPARVDAEQLDRWFARIDFSSASWDRNPVREWRYEK